MTRILLMVDAAVSVNGVCQSCGAIAPIEWFLADADHRKLCALMAEMPRDVAPLALQYLALFKPSSGKAVRPSKAVRLITELKALVATGYVQEGHRPARPCPPRIWAQAIEQMIERRDRLTLPMPNHNYLKSIAWDLADRADAQREYTGQQIVSSRTVRDPQHIGSVLSPIDQYIQGQRETKPTDEEMAEWKKSRLQNL